jgi:hypothetical protein
VPTFPTAKYLFAERELAFWTERHKQDASLDKCGGGPK